MLIPTKDLMIHQDCLLSSTEAYSVHINEAMDPNNSSTD